MIRIYGHIGGEGSFRQVTRGMVRAATRTSHFAGLMPIDRVPGDDDPVPPGAEADVALHCGAPMSVIVSHTQGRHKRHYLLLAPNSYGVPPLVRAALREKISTFTGEDTASSQRSLLDGLLAPSAWAADVLRQCFPDHEVRIAPHGIDPDIFAPDLDVHGQRALSIVRQQFRVLHFTSTLGQRKGTEELLIAWGRLRRTKKLPELATLGVIVSPLAVNDYLWTLRELGIDDRSVTVIPSPQAPQSDVAAALRWAHLVVQPSRAEGFGLCPLESRACGTPVCATMCTGHGEHMSPVSPGVVAIDHGPDAPVDDYDGAMAPTVSPDAIESAIAAAYENWGELSGVAMASANGVGSRWSWENVNRQVLDELDARS